MAPITETLVSTAWYFYIYIEGIYQERQDRDSVTCTGTTSTLPVTRTNAESSQMLNTDALLSHTDYEKVSVTRSNIISVLVYVVVWATALKMRIMLLVKDIMTALGDKWPDVDQFQLSLLLLLLNTHTFVLIYRWFENNLSAMARYVQVKDVRSVFLKKSFRINIEPNSLYYLHVY